MSYLLKESYHIAVPTSFDSNEELNIDATIRHIVYLQNLGVKSVLVCGSTGEQHSLTFEEKCILLNGIQNDIRLKDNLEILFGVASIRQVEAVKLAQLVNESNRISGVLLGFPPYILPTQEEASNYVHAIAASYHKPILLYNNPKRTGFNLEIPTLIKLASIPNIIGLKEAGDENRASEINFRIAKPFYLYAGGEINLESKINLGFNRLSSIAGNLYPLEIKEWFESLLNKNQYDFKLKNEITEIFNESPLVYLKEEISKRENICMEMPRNPLGNFIL